MKSKKIISFLFAVALFASYPLAQAGAAMPASASVSAQQDGNSAEVVEIGVVEDDAQPGNGGSALLTTLLAIVMLTVIFLALKNWGKRKPSSPAGGESALITASAGNENEIPGEILAAIAATLHELNENQHDTENAVLTIRPASQRYSPWNSRSLTLKRSPRK